MMERDARSCRDRLTTLPGRDVPVKESEWATETFSLLLPIGIRQFEPELSYA
jgi:hypothetical protein